jgi:transposase-like protein
MAVRIPLTEAKKQYIYNRKKEGVTLKQIACEINCSLETARKWWRYLRDGTQPHPRGHPPAGILSTYPASVRETVIAIKRDHPH